MKSPRFLLFAATLVAAFPLMAAAPTQQEVAEVLNRPTIPIREGTTTDEYLVVLDEFRVKQRNGGVYRMAPFPPAATGAAVLQAALNHEQTRGEKTDLFVYSKDADHDEASERVLTRDILLQVGKGVRARTIATSLGARVTKQLTYAPDLYMLEATDAGAALVIAEKLRNTAGVLYAEVQLAKRQLSRLIPNDPLFAQQWHLTYSLANVTPTWDSFLGNGIRIGIIDDGMQNLHPDLSPNADVSNDTDYNSADGDSTPPLNSNPNLVPPPPAPGGRTTDDFHGTAVAGVAAARGGNATGISGVAPRATLVGMRLTADVVTDQQEAEAFSHRNDIIQVKNNSWGPADDGRTLQDIGPLAEAAMQAGVINGRGRLGTIYVWAAGNGALAGDNSNKDGYANSIYTIAVAACNRNLIPGGPPGSPPPTPPFPAMAATYSEPGANIMVTAPGGQLPGNGIVTTDLTGNDGTNYAGAADLSDRNYTNRLQGTSFSAPFVSGVVALLLQANPNLGWRDVQEILMRTAFRFDPGDPEWIVNGSGLNFHHRYGAGLVSVDSAIPYATSGYVNLGPQTRVQVVSNGLSAILDNPAIPAERQINVQFGPARLEHVELTLNIAHPWRGDIAVELVSPAGTTSRMVTSNIGDSNANYTDWTFMTVRNWGEGSQGVWTIRVIDEISGISGALSRCTLTMYGTGAAGGGGGTGGGIAIGGSNAGGGDNAGGGNSAGGGVGGGGANAGGGLVGVSSNSGGGVSGGGSSGGGGGAMAPVGAGGGTAAGGGSAGPSTGGGPAGAGASAGGGR